MRDALLCVCFLRSAIRTELEHADQQSDTNQHETTDFKPVEQPCSGLKESTEGKEQIADKCRPPDRGKGAFFVCHTINEKKSSHKNQGQEPERRTELWCMTRFQQVDSPANQQ